MKYGFKSVTMDDIARELGISKKTLYQFVDNKADLIQKVVCKFIDSEQETIDAIQKDSIDAIEEMLNIENFEEEELMEYTLREIS